MAVGVESTTIGAGDREPLLSPHKRLRLRMLRFTPSAQGGLLLVVAGLLAGILAVTVAAHASGPPRGVEGDDWSLVFSDTFTEGSLDSRRWTTCYWWDVEGCINEGNQNLNWYQPDNVTITEGVLRLRAERERVTASDGSTYSFTSGMVTTGRATSTMSERPRFAFRYGYLEVRARVPSGRGLWPALWLLPATHESKPEVDLLEVKGHEPAIAQFHVHYVDKDDEVRNPGHEWKGEDLSDGWHTYGLHWSPEAVVWYVDGEERWYFDDRAHIPDEQMYLIANLAVGGTWVGPPDAATPFPATFDIDHVKIWQRDARG